VDFLETRKVKANKESEDSSYSTRKGTKDPTTKKITRKPTRIRS